MGSCQRPAAGWELWEKEQNQGWAINRWPQEAPSRRLALEQRDQGDRTEEKAKCTAVGGLLPKRLNGGAQLKPCEYDPVIERWK